MKIYNLGSLNIDYVYSVEHFVTAGETLPSNVMEVFPGGKGLNQRDKGTVFLSPCLQNGAKYDIIILPSKKIRHF